MTKAEIEKQMTDLTNRFWVELTMKNFDEVDLIQKKMRRLEALLRIEEDEEEIKPNPAIPESEMLTFLKKLKTN
jgi:hypothetical protein